MLTLEEAARLSGKSKSTLARAIKAGRLSANRTDLGIYEIDQAELDGKGQDEVAPGITTVSCSQNGT
jgi:excisionase family DNA binding protein